MTHQSSRSPRRNRRTFNSNKPGRPNRSGNFRRGGSGPRGGGGRGRPKAQIDPRRFVNAATVPAEVIPYDPHHSFDDFPFEPKLKEAIRAKGFEHPTAIQDQAIPHVLAGKDLVGLANTGTGKTAGFVLPIVHRLVTKQSKMALIVAPTRELAKQINDEFLDFGKRFGFSSAVCVGGMREQPQISALYRKPEVVIGTPGRLKDFVNQKHLRLEHCDTFVLDEADRMLDMGFVHDMKFLMQHLPAHRQSLCFSATITPEVERIISQLLRDPVTVSVRSSVTSEHIEQEVIHADSKEEKLDHLVKMLSQPDFGRVLVFGETKFGVKRLTEKLNKAGIDAAEIHGNRNQSQRQRALDSFKRGRVRVLVATDVAARGIDVDDVSHVINYDTPGSYEDYVHRIGRTGRAGKGGSAITFVPRSAAR
ncbi:MAG: DEAD/DEAH box helicase [bacterium]|nr:DEAD/DEAH box helicase [bacterium]